MNKYVTNLTLPNGTNVLIKDSECRTNLSNEIRRATAKETELEEADTHLRNDLTTETNTRKQRDTALQNNINAEVSAREQGDNKNNAEIAKIHSNITSIENKNTEQDNELTTLRTMISSPYNFKGEVASLSALPASGAVNDTYYVRDVKYKVTWTGSAWVQSSLSEADYQTELGELKGDLTQLGFSLNIMTNDFVDNHYRDFNDGVDRVLNGYCEWDLKPINPDTTYYFNADAHITFFTNYNYSFIRGVEIVREGTFKTPSNASYITISFPMVKKEQVILSENKKPIFNIPIGVSTAEAIKKELDSKTSSNNIYVGANKDYTSLVRCFEDIRINNLKDVTVIIDSGEYDLIEDVVSVYGQSFINSYNKSIYDDVNGFKGLYLGNNINVVGNGRVVINCNYQGENDDFKLYFSPFHVYNKSYKISNINVVASNVRYCLHDDCYTTYGNNIAIIEKCEFVDNGTRAGACIGGGFTQGNDIVYINDCIFTSNSSNSIGYYYHTNPSSGKCVVKVNNCLLNNCKAYIEAYGGSINKSTMYVSNSKMPMLPYKNKIGSDTDNVDIIYWNIEIPSD